MRWSAGAYCNGLPEIGGSVDHARRTLSLLWTVRIQLAALALAHRWDGSARHLLFSLGDLKSSATSRPDTSGVRSADVTIDASRGLWACVFSPLPAADAELAPVPVVVYFHGGSPRCTTTASRRSATSTPTPGSSSGRCRQTT